MRQAAVQLEKVQGGRLPSWLRRPIAGAALTEQVRRMVADGRLHTVCQSARCPNLSECFGRGTATFMVLGDVCTRRCGFCAVANGTPLPVDIGEGGRIGAMARQLGLTYVVVTMVARDDLEDGGSSHVAHVVEQIRSVNPGIGVEVLVSDFQGRRRDVETVLAARPSVFNHNLETVERLQRRVRSTARYDRSLDVLTWAAQRGRIVKSGIMLGLGETETEVAALLVDLRHAGCRLLTIGQYLKPVSRKLPVTTFVAPEQFERYRQMALEKGFWHVAAGPYVRSSYRAAEAWHAARCSRIDVAVTQEMC